jgi:hypothetical protein
MVEEPTEATEIRQIHEEIRWAITQSPYTLNDFAQQMNMKLKTLQSYIDGRVITENITIKKKNRFLNPTKIKPI